MRFDAAILAAAVTAAALFSPSAAHEDESSQDRPKSAIHVLLEVRRSDERQAVKKYALTVVENGRDAQLSTGARVPVPATTVKTAEDGSSSPVTSFTYQNVGFDAAIRAEVLDSGRIMVTGKVSESGFRPGTDGASGKTRGQPVTESFSYRFESVVPEGEPVEVLEFRDPHVGRAVLLVTARIAR